MTTSSTLRVLLRLGFLAVLASIGAGCFVARVWMVDYRFETSASRTESGTETTLATSAAGQEDLAAGDDPARFAFEVEPGRIRVRVENQGTDALFLDVADASYVDALGQKHRLSVVDQDAAPVLTLKVPGRSTARISMWPEDWNHGQYKGQPLIWRGDSPLDGASTIEETSRESALEKRRQDIGRDFEIVLPLRIAGRRAFYQFRFAVAELIARRTWTA
jgi:hypothetical protein